MSFWVNTHIVQRNYFNWICSTSINSCLVPKVFILNSVPDTLLIRNNAIHISHVFLMKLNLEECGLWWEAAMICEVCAQRKTTGGWDPAGAYPPFPSAATTLQTCSGHLQQVPIPFSSLSHLDMCFKCQFLINMHEVFAFGSYNIYGQKSTWFPGFQAKPSPIGATPNTWVPAHFELI